jgi:hypothetical protein
MGFSIFSIAIGFVLSIVCLAIIGRFGAFFSEPEHPIKTPFGKLPFFDGIIVYGIVLALLVMVLQTIIE